MAESKNAIQSWMVELADKHGISVDAVVEFYYATTYDRSLHRTRRKRTEDFFDLYFEGVKENEDEKQ